MQKPQSGQIVLSKACPACGKQFAFSCTLCDVDQSILQLRDKDPLLNTVIAGRYRLTAILGTGGWGRVYAAHHETLNKMVAVKVMHSHMIDHAEKVTRFEQEAQAACDLRHPNIAAVYDFGTTETGQPYLVMDLFEGDSLEKVIESQHHLKISRALEIFKQIASALGEAHHKGIIHRDIKPANIMLSVSYNGRETAKLVDFGLAKITGEDGRSLAQLTDTGETLGTPFYMAPEQCMGHRLDARADIYSLGCVMYECLTGVVPFAGNTAFECMSMHVKYTPPPFGEAAPSVPIPAQLEDIVFKCLEKDANKRYQDASQLLSDLERVQAGPSSSLHAPVAVIRRPWRMFLHRVAQNRHAIICGGICVAVLAGIALFEQTETQKQDPQSMPPADRWNFYMLQAIRHIDTGDYEKALQETTKAKSVADTFPTTQRSELSVTNRSLIHSILSAKKAETMPVVRRGVWSLPAVRIASNAAPKVDVEQVKLFSNLLDNIAAQPRVDKNELEELGKRINEFCSGEVITIPQVRQLEEKNNRLLRQYLGTDNVTYGMSCGHLGFGSYYQGDYAPALTWLKLDYDILCTHVPISDGERAKVTGSLGSAYYLNNDFKNAEHYLSITVQMLNYLPDLETRSNMMQNLGLTYQRMGKDAEAYSQWKDFVAFWEKQGNYQLTDFGMLQLVYTSDRLHRNKQTESMLIKQRDALSAQFGQDYVGVTLYNLGLAELYLIEQRWPEAENAAWKACLYRQLQQMPYSSNCYRSIQTLARIYMAQKKYQQAIPLYQLLLAGTERSLILGTDGGVWLDDLSKLAYLKQVTGDERGSQMYLLRFKSAMPQFKPSRTGYDCSRCADQTFSLLAGKTLSAPDYDRLLELIKPQRRCVDPDGTGTYLPCARSFDAFSRIYLQKGDFERALQNSQSAVKLVKDGSIAYYWLPGRVFKQYAAVLRALGRNTEARQAEKEGSVYPQEAI
jgi:serine/threonine-protein kinase